MNLAARPLPAALPRAPGMGRCDHHGSVTQPESDRPSVPIRRQPPRFRRVSVRTITMLSPHMARVTLTGPDLDGLEIPAPAASVRLLIPSPGTDDLVIPTWNGNEFLLAGGDRPIIRTFTPRYLRPDGPELDLDIVLHELGATSDWVRRAESGDRAAVSGTGRGYQIDDAASGYLLAGDQTAIPAISQLLEHLPHTVPAVVIIEIVAPDAEQELPQHPNQTVQWVVLDEDDPPGSALVPAVTATSIRPGTRVWAAGEAASMHRIRRHLFDELTMARSDATVRGYWKHGR